MERAAVDTYPATTATEPATLMDGQRFEAKFAPLNVIAVRVLGKPATGDKPEQSFSSCAELQAFAQ